MVLPLKPNPRWSPDFVTDRLTPSRWLQPNTCRAMDHRRLRIMTVVDDCTRERQSLVADTSLSGARAARELATLIDTPGKPRTAFVTANADENTERPHSRRGCQTPAALTPERGLTLRNPQCAAPATVAQPAQMGKTQTMGRAHVGQKSGASSNRAIKEATVKHFHYENQGHLRTNLADVLPSDNFVRRLKALGGPHALRIHLQNLDIRPGSNHPKPNPPDAGNGHLATGKVLWRLPLRFGFADGVDAFS